MKILLEARQPFSLATVVRSHGWIQLPPFQRQEGDLAFGYVHRLSTGRLVDILVEEAPNGVAVTAGEASSDAERQELAQVITWMLGLDQDFSEFYALARDEPKLSGVEARASGRVLRSATLFEDAVKTILTTNTTWSGTIRMVGGLVSQFGEPVFDDPTRRAFPTPVRLAQADVETLRNETRLGYRAPYVLDLAQQVAAGSLDLEALKVADAPTDELRKQLLAIKGIGGYAAANLLVLLGRYDFLPVDSWAMKLVSHEWYDGEPIGPAAVEAAFERWGSWKSLAYWFWDWEYKG